MGCIGHGKVSDVGFPPSRLRHFDGPACSAVDMWHILGHGLLDSVPVVGTIIRPVLGLQAGTSVRWATASGRAAVSSRTARSPSRVGPPEVVEAMRTA
eukprot:14508584-Alexandrium_andersonii.AAC.1